VRIPWFFLLMLSAATSARASVEISSKPTQNMTCSGGVCAPTAKSANLNTADLTNMLATSDVKVLTGNGAVTITITAPLTWASGRRLTLDASYNVSFRSPVSVIGQGGLTIITGHGTPGGDLIFFSSAKINFNDLGGSLIINRKRYALVGDVATLGADILANRSGLYALAKDYDALSDGTYSTPPVSTTLQGLFEGLGHTVANLSVSDRRARCVGLFAKIGPKGTVRDIVMKEATILPSRGRYAREGALAGCNDGTVANSSASGTVSGWWVGGLVGYNEGLVTRCSSDAMVEGKFAGGLVGISDGTISYSYATGAVTGLFEGKRVGMVIYAGGLAGVASTVIQSFATGAVSVHGQQYLVDRHSGAGGLVGEAEGAISDSYSAGPVSSTGTSVIGGLIGRGHRAKIRNAYAIDAVAAGEDEGAAQGGLAGRIDADKGMEDAYWNLDTSGQLRGCGQGDCSGVSGLTDEQLKSVLPNGLAPEIWAQNKAINNGYPYLLGNPPPR